MVKYGFFNQNFLSDTFAETELQPILAYTFNTGWRAEIGDAQYTYDWQSHRLTLIPLSGQVNRIVSINGQSVHFFSEPSTTRKMFPVRISGRSRRVSPCLGSNNGPKISSLQ